MTEILLTLIIVLLLGYHAWSTHQNDKAKRQLVDALIARSATELRDLRIAEKTKIEVKPSRGEMPDMVPLDQVNDDDLLEAVKETYGR